MGRYVSSSSLFDDRTEVCFTIFDEFLNKLFVYQLFVEIPVRLTQQILYMTGINVSQNMSQCPSTRYLRLPI